MKRGFGARRDYNQLYPEKYDICFVQWVFLYFPPSGETFAGRRQHELMTPATLCRQTLPFLAHNLDDLFPNPWDWHLNDLLNDPIRDAF